MRNYTKLLELAKQNNLNPQILLTRFFMERFLEQIALSKYKNNFVLKGGF